MRWIVEFFWTWIELSKAFNPKICVITFSCCYVDYIQINIKNAFVTEMRWLIQGPPYVSGQYTFSHIKSYLVLWRMFSAMFLLVISLHTMFFKHLGWIFAKKSWKLAHLGPKVLIPKGIPKMTWNHVLRPWNSILWLFYTQNLALLLNT